MARFGWHFHTIPSNTTYANVLDKLDLTGGGALRMDTNWSNYQPNAPTTVFSASSYTMSTAAYNSYLLSRGYSAFNGINAFQWLFDDFSLAQTKDIKVVYNFGVLPNWAKAPYPPGITYGIDTPGNPTYVGAFLADFIIYCARQPNGINVLKNVSAWQVFNEINNVYGGPNDVLPVDQTPNDGIWNPVNVPMVPYNEYFKTIENAMSLTKQAYAAINWASVSGGVAPPPVAGPTLGGVYDTNFWQALFDYQPVLNDPSLVNAMGNLKIESATLHPYGNRIDAWNFPDSGFGTTAATPYVDSVVQSNLTFHRCILPTDDILTWKSLTARDDVGSTNTYNLFQYSSAGNTAGEQYFDRNTELGMERTMARLDREGYAGIKIQLTEWGASTYLGEAGQTGYSSLANTTFADPYKYGYIAQGQILTRPVAENLQSEAIVQTLGLIEGWDFVDSATSYEIFDQDSSTYQGQFGLAYGVNADGSINYKMAGLAYNAYMAGTAYNGTNLSGAAANIGVNIHIQALGVSGTFSAAARETETAGNTLIHELVLLRDGNDTFDGGNGDDIVFGGTGNDTLAGGNGFDRLYGGDGDDILSGGANDDRLKGGAGNDTLTGGTGKDGFVFSAFSATGSGFGGNDTITDFEVGQDTVMTVGGYATATLLNNALYPNLIVDVAGGVKIYYADNGASITLLGAGISESTLTANMFLVYEGDTTVGYTPPSSGTITGTSGNDTLTGTANGETIGGLAGNDSIHALGGNDTLNGGDGDDWLIGGAGADIINGGLGWDLVDYYSSATGVVVSLASGTGTAGDAAGDTLAGIETLGGSGFNDTLTGDANYNNIWGSVGDDNIDGGASTDSLWGGEGNDTLNGGIGDDSLYGGLGNDTFIVDSAADTVTEALSEGTDLVKSTVTIAALAANVENLTLTGSGVINGTGNALANIITGNAVNNTLNGGDGNDTLNGGAGVDTLVGGLGNDVFIVDTTTDVITEASGGGTDTVQSSVTISALAANVENLTLTGTAAINGTGNALVNSILGNSGDNFLVGGAGSDTINGGLGYDLADYYGAATGVTVNLTSGTGVGGDAQGDVLSSIEAIGGSNAGADVLTGNSSNNGLWGNGGNDTLTGGAGNDTLSGAAGNDTFVFATGFGADQVNDFTAGAGVGDVLRLTVGTAFDTYAEVYAATTQVGANAVINISGSDSITLLNVLKTSMVADDFLFL